jgi:[CysO sulfur-carrier protein]-S-L-cysteine hydrolase
VSAATPATVRAGRHCLIVLERVLLAAAPLEGCALLLGQRRGNSLVLQRIWPCCNRWQPQEDRQHRFLLDPREQLLAQRWARDRQLQVLGAAHSHPSSEAVPSASDLTLSCGPALMLIRSGLPVAAPLRAWWLPDCAGWETPSDADSDTGPGSPAMAPRELPLELEPESEAPAAGGSGHLGE